VAHTHGQRHHEAAADQDDEGSSPVCGCLHEKSALAGRP
jgi:hypothetical protein